MTLLEKLNLWLTFAGRVLGAVVVGSSIYGFFVGLEHSLEFFVGGAGLLSATVVSQSIVKSGKALRGDGE